MNGFRLARLSIAVAVLSSAAACGALKHAAAPPLPQAGSAANAAVLPTSAFCLGVYERGAPAPSTFDKVARFATAVGSRPRIVLYFSGWGEPFQTTFADQARDNGAMPLVQINPTGVSIAKIAAGMYDRYLKMFADQVRTYAYPVVIGFAHEMNGWWYTWGWTHTPPSTWVAAWRHVVTVFRQRGAFNVTWMWTINRTMGRSGPVRDYWPGASYVNWVGIDGYYFKQQETFQTDFAATVISVRRFTHDPIFLAEVGIGQVAGQAQKLPGLFAGVRRYHLMGLLWYDVAQHAGLYHQDWRIEDSPTGTAALRAALRGLR